MVRTTKKTDASAAVVAAPLVVVEAPVAPVQAPVEEVAPVAAPVVAEKKKKTKMSVQKIWSKQFRKMGKKFYTDEI